MKYVADRYDVLAQLGRGGMATVYRVRDSARGEELALKLLTTEGHSPRRVELFEREYHTLTELAHPRIVRARDYGVEGEQPYYTMELLDGGDLRAHAPMPWQAACLMAYEICSALSLLHSRRLVHRDLTPRNVRLTASGEAKLIDLGLLAPFGPTQGVLGTPPYVAPELVHGLSLDGRADLFSLGATLYRALTGHTAFPARRFDELRDCWRGVPRSPSRYVPEIPKALDQLVLALLRIDVGSRPKSAAEVMDRLRPLLAEPPAEELKAARAYLTAPRLLGRADELTRVRKQMVRAMRGRGGGFLIVGEPGSGRTRMIDGFVLEAKLIGAVTARADESDAAAGTFGVATALVRQLLEGAGPAMVSLARDNPELWSTLFERGQADDEDALPELRDLTQAEAERPAVQAALRTLIQTLSERKLLAIAVDDLERADEASAALLAMLALGAESHRFVFAASTTPEALDNPSPSLETLKQSALSMTLSPLSAAQTTELLTGIFGDVPQLQGLSARLHALSEGRPRELMGLSQHLVDEGIARYADGGWNLPAELPDAALPARVSEAFTHQVDTLSPEALEVGQFLSLCVLDALSRGQLLQLTGYPSAVVDRAVDDLRRARLLTGSATHYRVASSSARAALLERQGETSFASLHDRLGAVLEEAGAGLLVVSHHRLQGVEPETQLARMLGGMIREETRVAEFERGAAALGESLLLDIFVRGLAIATQSEKRTRDLIYLWTYIGVTAARGADPMAYLRTPAEWLQHLRRYSGLDHWADLDHVKDPTERAVQAVVAAKQRHDALPAAERVLAPDEAIKLLSYYVLFAIGVAGRTCERNVVAGVEGLLDPLAPLSPLVAVVAHNARSSVALLSGRREQARAINLEMLALLDTVEREPGSPAETMYAPVAIALAALEVGLGIQPEPRRLSTDDPNQRVMAETLRKVAALHRGDGEAAERHRRQAELIALEHRATPMFSVLHLELEAHALARDLTGVKAVRTRLHQFRARPGHEGWQWYCALADIYYLYLCGESDEALAAIDAMRGDARRAGSQTYAMSTALAVELLAEHGKPELAREWGLEALEASREADQPQLVRRLLQALSLAEAKLGDFAQARAHLEEVIAAQERLGVVGLLKGRSYEYLARVAILARDQEGFERAAMQAAEHYRPGQSSVLGVLYERLIDEARHAGLEPPEFRSSALGAQERDQLDATVKQALAGRSEPAARATAALELLLKREDEALGHLYLMTPEGLQLSASTRAPVDGPLLATFAQGQVDLELDDEVDTLSAGSQDGLSDDPTQDLASVRDADGVEYYPVPLIGYRGVQRLVIGVALLSEDKHHSDNTAMAGAIAEWLVDCSEYAPVSAA